MKLDISKLIYDKYTRDNHPEIELILINGEKITGFISGFYHGSEEDGEPFVIAWHVSSDHEIKISGADLYGVPSGRVIKTSAISQITFLPDNYTIRLKI